MDGKKTGRHLIIEQFLSDGITYMFGNPGTVEQGFLDALKEYPEMEYILTLQESIALMMGDAYARATKKTALVQIHSSPGLGNTIGALYQAMRGHSPIVVIGGDAGLKYMPMEAQMYGELVDFAKPVTKWSTMVKDSASLLRTLRRAIKVASTPPMGPVYICLPADLLDEPAVEEVRPTFIPSTKVVPGDDFINESVALLVNAKKPVFFIGDGIAYSKAQKELESFAELLGAEVWGVDSGELNMSAAHPLYQGQTGHMFGGQSLPITQKGDVNLVCGTYMVPEVFPELGSIFAKDAKVIHIDLNAYEIAKNHPVDLGIVSDPKLTLNKLYAAVESLMTAVHKEEAKMRFDKLKEEKETALKCQMDKDKKKVKKGSVEVSLFMEELAKHVADDVIIFDEALTSSPELNRYLPPKYPDHYFQTRGGSLGVGIPGALAAKLANPDKMVIGFTGDGGSMYTIQALWTAAHHKIGAKFVICNNHSYHLLQLNIDEYWKENGIQSRAYPECFSLTNPAIDFVKVSEGLGVPAIRVEKRKQIKEAIKKMLDEEGPFLIDLFV